MKEKRKQLEIGNSTIDASEEFAEGYYEGRIYYYDDNNKLREPMTSEQLNALLDRLFKEPFKQPAQQSGRIVGLLVALCENDPNRGFTSINLPEEE